MNDESPPMKAYLRHEVKAMMREERRRVRFDAWLGIALALALGWVYARLARAFGAPPNMIGLVAILCQGVTFACVMMARFGAVIWKRKL